MSSNKDIFTFNFNEIKQHCKKIGIQIQQIADGKLDEAYKMQGLKVHDQKTNNICYIFISLIKEGTLNISSFFQGKNIIKKDATKVEQLLESIITSLNKISQKTDKVKGIQAYQKQMLQLYENLNSKSEKVLKSASNQMMAVQEIKQSNEYTAVCAFIKSLSQEVNSLCKKVKQRQQLTNQQNEKLIEMMLEVEKEKQFLQENSYKYNGLVKQLNDVEGYLNKFIAQKKQKLKVQDFNDEQGFSLYLEQASGLKRLENQKKYLSRG